MLGERSSDAELGAGLQELIAGIARGVRNQQTTADVGQIEQGATDQLPEEQVNQTAVPPSLLGEQATAGIPQRVIPEVAQDKIQHLEAAAEDIRKRNPELYLKMLPEIDKMRLNYKRQLEESKATERMQSRGKELGIPESQLGAMSDMPLDVRAEQWMKAVGELTGASSKVIGTAAGEMSGPAVQERAMARKEQLGYLRDEEQVKLDIKLKQDKELWDKDLETQLKYYDIFQRRGTAIETHIQTLAPNLIDPKTGQFRKGVTDDQKIMYNQLVDDAKSNNQFAAITLEKIRKTMPGAEQTVNVSPEVDKALSKEDKALVDTILTKGKPGTLVDQMILRLKDEAKRLPEEIWNLPGRLAGLAATPEELAQEAAAKKNLPLANPPQSIFAPSPDQEAAYSALTKLSTSLFTGRGKLRYNRADIQRQVDDAKQAIRRQAMLEGRQVNEADLRPLDELIKQAEASGKIQ